MSQQLLSIVIPLHNEEGNLPELYRRLAKTAEQMEPNTRCEFIFVDDGSTDGSFGILKGIAGRDERAVVVQLSRNWGSHPALKAGLQVARGDCCAAISADLQDPPEMLPSFVEAHQKGFEVVWGTRASRRDPFFKKLWATGFYALFRRLALPSLPEGGVDTFLISRRVKEELLEMKERNNLPYYQILWMGHPYAVVPYHRSARHAGVSKWSFRRRLRSAFDALISFTAAPLRGLSLGGCGLLAITLCWAALIPALGGSLLESWLGPLLCGLSGVQFLGLGILGEYIWRIAADLRQRPEYVVKTVARQENGSHSRVAA